MENSAILGVDSICVAYSQRPAGADGNSADMDPSPLAVWHFGTHHVARLKTAELRKHSHVAFEPICNVVWGDSPKLAPRNLQPRGGDGLLQYVALGQGAGLDRVSPAEPATTPG
jgi:hypothetical protein